jgi:NADH-quinone oxidoreductase subunit C
MSEETKEPNPPSVENSASASGTPTASATAQELKPAAPAAETQPVQAAASPLAGDKPAATAPKSALPAAAKPVAPAAAKPATPPPPKPAAPKPEPWDSPLVRALKAQYGSGIREASTYAKQNCVLVDSSIVYEILLRLSRIEVFDYCVDVTAVHYPNRDLQFDVVYVLYSFHTNQRLRLKTQIKDGEHLRSAVAIWPTANWLEREVFDMFGIEFDGHPELKRILMPEDWKGHPLRKDYGILQQDTEWVKTNIGIESAQ